MATASSSVGDCDPNALLCTKGAIGPLCGSCSDGYTFNSALSLCVECGSSSNTSPIYVACGLLVALSTAALLKKALKRRNGGGHGAVAVTGFFLKPIFRVLRQVDKGQLKVVYSTLQIVSTISWNLNVSEPQNATFGSFTVAD